MNPQLEAYKKNNVRILVTIFNNNVSTIRRKLVSKINTIQNSKIHVKIKSNNILFIQKKYNSNIISLKRKLALDIKRINLSNVLPQRSIPDKFAVLVGINYKNTPNELYGCINDTKNIQTFLQTKYGFNNFIFLTDETNKKPTKQNILTTLTNLLVNSISGDSLFFLYSGHGTCTTDLNRDEVDGQDELIVPIDAINIKSCILDDELNLIIKNNLKPGVKLFALFDSCFSGTVLDLKYNFDKLDTMIANSNIDDTLGQVIMISGCNDSQTSTDAFINNKNTGAMTFSFITTIEQYGTSITLKQLVENMRILLNNNGFEQIPQLSSGTSIDINTYLLQF
jgi:hypothetical protein